MPVITTQVECKVHDSFRVQKVAGMFDVPLSAKVQQTFTAEVPGLDEAWSVGAIVGPSGSGKSTIARAAYGEDLYVCGDWPSDKAVIDALGDHPVKEITHVLTSVGFSSPPSWVKPYGVLSNGEKFRCDLAHALLSGRKVIPFDEFSSLVDRTVAKIGSAAVARSIRSGKIKTRFVAITCHYDIVEWLEPDWVLDMATGTLARGLLQCRRPEIRLEVVRCDRSAWRLFAKHHYLSQNLHQSAQCYLALWEGEPVAFCAMLANFGHKSSFRISRTVCLPDYQGIGIGIRLSEAVGQLWIDKGYRVTRTSSHPALIAHCSKSPLWRIMRINPFGNSRQAKAAKEGQPRVASTGRAVVSFEYIGVRK